MDPNCVIIKKKELEELHNTLKTERELYRKTLENYAKEITELKDAVKPDEIKVKIFVYKEKSNWGGYKEQFTQVGTEVTSQINFSQGIQHQVNRILRLVREQYDKIYSEQYNQLKFDLERNHQIKFANLKKDLHLSLRGKFGYKFIYDRFTIFNKISEVFK
jgi:hypothetical protein